MPISLRIRFIILLILSGITAVHAQKVENLRFEQSGKQIVIFYDLTNTQSDDVFNIQVLLSRDNGLTFSSPLTHVTGDAGKFISGGYGKRIVWNPLEDVEKLTGEIMFQLEVTSDKQSNTFTDPRDGEKYKIIKIGNQIWMSRNMNYRMSAGCWCYNNIESNCSIYGRLYTWTIAGSVCPAGWHLPTDEEWSTMETLVSGTGAAGLELKSISGWEGDNSKLTDTFKFSAKPGGMRWPNGVFEFEKQTGMWWVNSPDNKSGGANAFTRILRGSLDGIFKLSADKKSGCSVRCIRD